MKDLLTYFPVELKILIPAVPLVVISPIVDLASVVWILVWLFIVDLLSGLCASYFVWKCKDTTPESKYFFGQSGGFESDRFKKCFIKGIIYGAFPLVVLKFQQVFLIKNMKFSSISDSQIDITTACILIFCANEFWSIFWENLPKCGVNIPGSIRDMILGIKDLTNKKQ